jgi:hypothetical protein
MKPKVSLAVSALVLLAGTAGASAQYYSNPNSNYWANAVSQAYQAYAFDPGYGGYQSYALGPGAQSYGSVSSYQARRCINAWQRYSTSPPGGVIQDRGYQQNVLGVPWC